MSRQLDKMSASQIGKGEYIVLGFQRQTFGFSLSTPPLKPRWKMEI
jgi:hypothetical protein